MQMRQFGSLPMVFLLEMGVVKFVFFLNQSHFARGERKPSEQAGRAVLGCVEFPLGMGGGVIAESLSRRICP